MPDLFAVPTAAVAAWELEIDGPARTKKTSNQAVIRNGRPMVFPSKDWLKWCRTARIHYGDALLVLDRRRVVLVDRVGACPSRLWTPLADRLTCRALFYLSDRQHGDLLGYMQGLADLLETRGVIANDRQLTGWDGTRAIYDRERLGVLVRLERVV